jgi:hypothetical protein
MVQTLEMHVLCLSMPNLLPLSLGESPLLILLFHTSQQDRHDIKRMGEHVIDNINTAVTVNLLANPFENGCALAGKCNRQLKSLPFRGRHGEHLLSNRLQELDALKVSLDIEIIIVTLFFNTVQAFLELVLPVCNKSTIF